MLLMVRVLTVRNNVVFLFLLSTDRELRAVRRLEKGKNECCAARCGIRLAARLKIWAG